MERIAHEDPTIRATAISLLGDIKHAPAATALQAAWDAAQKDTSSQVREAIVDSLKALGPAAARDTLKKALADRDWALRLKAARYLKEIDPAAAADVDIAIRPAPTTVDRAVYETLAAPKFSPHAFIDTRKGTIEIELAVLDAPLTSHNFVTLARRGFFNGLRIHRRGAGLRGAGWRSARRRRRRARLFDPRRAQRPAVSARHGRHGARRARTPAAASIS